jgi:hypothetical protein
MTSALVIIQGRDAASYGSLNEAAAEIRRQVAIYQRAEADAYEAQLATGRALAWARHQMKSDQDFGAWFRAQDFGFSTEWGRQLRRASEHEPEVRAAVATQVATGARPNLKKALKAASRPDEPEIVSDTEVTDAEIVDAFTDPRLAGFRAIFDTPPFAPLLAWDPAKVAELAGDHAFHFAHVISEHLQQAMAWTKELNVQAARLRTGDPESPHGAANA